MTPSPQARRPLFDETDRVVMRACAVLGVVFLAVMAAGCEKKEIVGDARSAEALTTYGPDRFGVVCYQVYTTSGPLSCVKVQP